MEAASTHRTVRRLLLTIFLFAELFGVGGLYLLLRAQGIREAERQARVVLTAAGALRTFTEAEILPALDNGPGQPFHDVGVPSRVAQSVFHQIGADDRAYAYREAALNPTNPNDRATPFEVDLTRRFAGEPRRGEITGLTKVDGADAFFVARPFRISDPRCLVCHSTPQAAPPAMIARYGSSNGFGWRLGDVVGVQLLTIPVASQFRGTVQLVALLSGVLLLVFAATYLALSRALDATLLGPLRKLAEAADAASRSDAAPPMPRGGGREIAELAAAIERLRVSLRLALERLTRGARQP